MKASVLVLVVSLFIAPQPSSAQWVQTNGPRGCVVYDMMVSDTTLFMTPTFGVYQFDLGHNAWAALSQSVHCSKLVAKGDTLFGCCGGTVCLSTDNGVTWSAADHGLPTTGGPVLQIALCGTSLFASIPGNMIMFRPLGFFRSTDDGASWTCVLSGGTFNTMASYVNSEGDTILLAGTGNDALFEDISGVYKSTNHGLSWSPAGLGGSYVWTFAVLHDTGGNATIFAGSSNGIFRSTDDAVSWVSSCNGVNDVRVSEIGVDSSNGKIRLYAGTIGGNLYYSDDGGTQWNALDSWVLDAPNTGSVRSIVRFRNALYISTASSIFRSTDSCASWEYLCNGLPYLLVTALAVHSDVHGNDNLFAGTYANGTFRSTDRGNTWVVLTNPYGSASVNAMMVHGDYVYASGSVGVSRSTDDGESWSPSDSSLTVPIYSLAASDSIVFAGGDQGSVYKSTDYGSHWSRVHADVDWNNCTFGMAIGGEYVYAGREYGLCRSSDGGEHWSDVNSNYIISVACLGSRVFAGKVNGGLIASTDSGASWTDVTVGASYNKIAGFAQSSSTLFAGGSTGVFKTTEGSATWDSISDGTPTNVVALAASQSYIYAGINTQGLLASSNAGVWRRPLSEVSGVTVHSRDIPTQFTLEQNYPNPFNPSTFIRYQVPGRAGNRQYAAGGKIRLVVYDLLGREVAVLVDETKPPGSYEVRLDASKLASGVYFYRLSSGSFVSTRKMALTK